MTGRPCRRSGLAAGLLVLLAAPHAAGEAGRDSVPLRIAEQSHPYVVDATELDTLRAQIDGHRPERGDGRASHGLLRIDLELHYRLQPEGGECRLEQPEVRLTMRLSLPEWRPRDAPSEPLEAAWLQMREGLVLHEEGHREMALETAQELAWAVDRVSRTQADCGALRRELLALRLSHLSRLALRSSAYDRRTAHGLRQGAVLEIESSGLDACDRRDSALRRDCAPR
ncbi:DUF922 domain-containing protein [Pseudomarimonas salicorniae]|uniref:DUF922 domain-containing Zn-dependent protease n=1 Tax=Pseudomarimonas salicorniae TaxID=2933270 RepID=A0ABT0GC80_9GAMM|nr:DUF922 domain-containing protein [Lysobacter sp. CAU 1642]MCK7592144.1 DUF922 domain-containing Zn-dependent protease [Lysobacter sp. CAU 1642]